MINRIVNQVICNIAGIYWCTPMIYLTIGRNLVTYIYCYIYDL